MLEKRRFLKLFLAMTTIIPIIMGSVGVLKAATTREVPEFESKNPGILPISPFYFLKQWRRDIIRSFTKDPLSQAVFELAILDEKAAELKRVRDLRPDDTDAITEALNNYKNSQMKLKEILRGLNADQIKSEKKERLVEETLKKVAAHEEYLTTLSDIYSKNKEVHPLTEGVQELSVEVVRASQVIPKEKFENIAKGYLRESTVLQIMGVNELGVGTSSSSTIAATTTTAIPLLVSSTTETLIPAIKESNKKFQ